MAANKKVSFTKLKKEASASTQGFEYYIDYDNSTQMIPTTQVLDDESMELTIEEHLDDESCVTTFTSSSSESSIRLLSDRVIELEKLLVDENKESELLRNRLEASEFKYHKLLNGLKKYLGDDQLQMMMGKKLVHCLNPTIEKAIMLKSKGGRQLLNFTRDNVVPMPSCETINRHLESLKFRPGILNNNLDLMAEEVKGYTLTQKSFMILFDEKAIVPGKF